MMSHDRSAAAFIGTGLSGRLTAVATPCPVRKDGRGGRAPHASPPFPALTARREYGPASGDPGGENPEGCGSRGSPLPKRWAFGPPPADAGPRGSTWPRIDRPTPVECRQRSEAPGRPPMTQRSKIYRDRLRKRRSPLDRPQGGERDRRALDGLGPDADPANIVDCFGQPAFDNGVFCTHGSVVSPLLTTQHSAR